MKKIENYKELIEKGVENYISTLKANDLYDELEGRINKPDPISFIKKIYSNEYNFSEDIFSDLVFSLDEFYEDFQLSINSIFKISFKNTTKYDYQILTEFYDWETKELKDSYLFELNESQPRIDKEKIVFLYSNFDVKWKIALNLEERQFDFHWRDNSVVNLVKFLNLINDIFDGNESSSLWFPIASSYASKFIFTTKKRYNNIVNLNLMPEDGFKFNNDDIISYSKGINSFCEYLKEELSKSNIICEVPVGGKDYTIYTKLYRKSIEGDLDIKEVPEVILKKLKTTSSVCNRMKWNYGNIILDANKTLADYEATNIYSEFSKLLDKTIKENLIDLKGKTVTVFKNDEDSKMGEIK